MRQVSLLLLLLLLLASRSSGSAYWNQIRHSALLPDGRVTIRMENPSGAGIQNFLLYTSGGIQEAVLTSVLDGPSTLEGTVPGPVSQRGYYGFRLLQGSEIDFLPVRLSDGATPTPQDVTRLAEDPPGDHLFGLNHLDLLDCRVSFNGTRLYVALKNAGGGFPVSSGLTFYGYLLGIADPSHPDPDTIFALMYTYNQPGIIGPGLYKVTGTGLSDLEKIGEISSTTLPSENTLLLSCELADLYTDPYFASWYDTGDPRISVAGFTQKITLLQGAQEADGTLGGDCYLRELAIDSEANQLPTLQGMQVIGSGASAYAQVSYADADPHCPVLSEIRFDGGSPYPMRPVTLDYGSTVLYRTQAGIPPLASGSWVRATARFSDNQSDIVEIQIMDVAASDDVKEDTRTRPRIVCFPNPFSSGSLLRLEGPIEGPARVAILDSSGRVVAESTPDLGLEIGGSFRWDGVDLRGHPVPSGEYFWQLTTPGSTATGKLVLVR